MPDDPTSHRTFRLLVASAAFVVLVAGLRAAAGIVVPFLLALFVSVICAPPLFALQERGLPRWLALLLVISAVAVLFGGLGVVLGSSVNEFTAKVPSYEVRLRGLIDAATSYLAGLGLRDQIAEARSLVNAGALLGFVRNLVAALGSALTNAFFVLLTTIFILLEATTFRGKLAAATGDPEASTARFELILTHVRRYLAIKTLTSLATGLLVAVALSLVGVDFVFLWGLLAFLLNFVPSIGSFIAAVPGVLQALVQLGWGSALVVAALYLVINLGIGSGVEPRVMGRSVGLSTLVVFASLVFWGWVLGPVGMLLSVPLTMAVKVALESDPATRGAAVLLGPAVEPRRPARPAEEGS